MSFWKKCPLLAAVIVSGLVIEGAGVANGVKSGEIENPASWKQPALATVFIDLKQGVYPWSDRSVQTAAMDAADVQKRQNNGGNCAAGRRRRRFRSIWNICGSPKKTDWIYRKPAGRRMKETGEKKPDRWRMLTGMQIIKNGTGNENEAGVSGNAVPGKAAEATQEAEEEPLEFTHVDKEYFCGRRVYRGFPDTGTLRVQQPGRCGDLLQQDISDGL